MNLTKEQHEDLVIDVNKFNEFLESFTEQVIQKVMLEIPTLVAYHVQEVNKIKNLRKQFYETNPELKGQEKVIIQAVNGIANKNPGMSREEVYRLAGVEAKKLLNMETTHG